MSDIQAVNNSSSDEVDLVELVKTLWQGKVTIAICTVVFTVCAIVYALTAQQWWTSKAVITAGQYKNTADIRSQITNLYAVINDSSKINNVLNSNALLNNYITEFNAFDNKKAFIENNEIMKQYADEAKLTDENKAQFITSWANRISASQPDKKNQPNIYQLSFEATSSKLAHDLLVAYSGDISNKVRNDLIDELDAKISYHQQILQANKISLEANAKQQLANELIKTNYALDMAKSADVTKPLADMNNSELFQIELGTEALAEKSKVLKKIKDLSVFQPQLGIIQTKLNLLSKVKIDHNLALQSVRYLQNTDYPISRDKPKRTLIAVLGFLLGMMLGVAIVLLKSAFNKNVK
ncbi:LPS O-antigen chain length determinant protein WzzB [Photobacterium angustum]|uniref:LPS O-antigen chain length determinant protein WzzB n=1 Tax=Photobacterium angustum TaxID=661 RepID=UPI0005E66E63|nr:Wzz/FepE/Etk N-terminal domain-containing protein [Photobacterium angustum]KJG02494.1 chain-length determining protein [Photobacterium angustum]KJG18157.1 chain-length determining protein [Photobacterium angustum]KJG26249.1 chain-length determining protein [Photobacterium angustum]KJG32258.1 chain-length determining protein [Photobacterium angustum]PSV67817.1 chain-length determining protein [Photobacterium angustum]